MRGRTRRGCSLGLLLPALALAALQLEEALRRATAACYAAEGVYPPDLQYLKDHYGIQVDETRYTVIYDSFASNLMPDITVLESEP